MNEVNLGSLGGVAGTLVDQESIKISSKIENEICLVFGAISESKMLKNGTKFVSECVQRHIICPTSLFTTFVTDLGSEVA